MKTSLLTVTLSTLFLLAGCAQMPGMALLKMPVKGGAINPQHYTPPVNADTPQQDAANTRAVGNGFVYAPKLEAYLERIARKIQRANQLPPLPGKIYLTSDSSFNAKTSPSGNIYVNAGLLLQIDRGKNLRNESALAGVLAHEMAHAYLSHHDIDAYQDMQQQVISAWDLLAILQRNLPSELTKNTKALDDNRYYRIAQNSGEVMSAFLLPAFSREQEYEADRYAADWLAQSGYHPVGVKNYLSLLELSQQETSSWPISAEDLASITNVLISHPEALADEAKVMGIKIIKAIAASNHPPTDKRIAAIASYVEEKYADVEPPLSSPEFKAVLASHSELLETIRIFAASNRSPQLSPELRAKMEQALSRQANGQGWMYMQVARSYESRGQFQQAKKMKMLAAAQAEAPLPAFSELADAEAKAQRVESALEWHKKGYEKLGKPANYLPFMVGFYHNYKKQGGYSERLMMSCMLKPKLKDACLKQVNKNKYNIKLL